jgi:ribosome maturation factor RimP
VGHKIKVALRQPLENQRRWEGTIAAVEENLVTLEAAGKTIQFDLTQVEKANLKFEW